MTSKNSFSSLMKEDLKAKLWLVLINSIMMFFNFTIVMAMHVQRVVEYIKTESLSYKEVTDILVYYVGGENRSTIFITLLMACVAGLSQFSYLYNKAQVDFYHSLPIRRQKRFLVRFVNGLLLYIVPYFVFCLSGLAIVSVFGYGNMEVVRAAFLGFFINIIGYLLCYATAILAVCLTGNIFTGICGMLTFFSYGYLVTLLAETLIEMNSTTYMPGYGGMEGIGNFLSPLGLYTKLSSVASWETGGNLLLWSLGAIIVAVLIVLVSLWTYLKRKSESAGKSIAFDKSKGVIKVFIMTIVLVLGTLFFWSVGYSQVNVWAVIGFVITLVLSQIIIQVIFEQDMKAIKLGVKSAAVSVVAAIMIFVGFELGGEYFDNHQIDWEEMAYAAVDLESVMGYPYPASDYDVESGEYIGREEYILEHMQITDTELMKEFIAACIASQKDIKNTHPELENQSQYYTYISIKYTMKNGKEIYRNYQATVDAVQTYVLKFLANKEYREGTNTIYQADIKDVYQIKYYDEWSEGNEKYLDMNVQEKEELIETYKEEYLNATTEELNEHAPVVSFVLETKKENIGEFDIATAIVYPSFVKTIAILEEKGVKIITLDEVELTKLTLGWYGENNRLEEPVMITYTEPEKLQELKESIGIGEYGYYTAFDMNCRKDSYSITAWVENKEKELFEHNAVFIKEVPEWVQEDLKNKQIEQEIEKTE